jgi:serine/threonine protein kinase
MAAGRASPADAASRLGNYRLDKTLGEGAFAKVKAAVHLPSGEHVAVKILYKHKITEDYVREHLHREGELMRRLRHPHIVALYEIIETERAYCLVLERADGGELLDHIVAHETLPEKEVRKYVRQLASAVDHLHKRGVVHRCGQGWVREGVRARAGASR